MSMRGNNLGRGLMPLVMHLEHDIRVHCFVDEFDCAN